MHPLQWRERREEGTAHPHYQRTTKPSSLELAGPVTRAHARAPTGGGRGSGQLAGGNGGKKGARRREGGRRSGQLSSLVAPTGHGGGGNGGSGGRRHRRGSVGTEWWLPGWEPLQSCFLSSNHSGLWASHFLTSPQAIQPSYTNLIENTPSRTINRL